MNHLTENRRDFLKRASMAAMVFPLLMGCKADILAQPDKTSVLSLIKKNANTLAEINWCGAIDAPDNVSWKTALAKKSDTDEAVLISGTVFQADGKTPAPNILIYFYHTDSTGYYGRVRGQPRHGHLRGWLLTRADGRYEFTSIKPAPYPNRTEAAHIHMTLTGTNFNEDSIDSILFEGDTFITPRERDMAGRKGGFHPIVKLENGPNGILRAARDIQLWKI